jgi:hypothetical protein
MNTSAESRTSPKQLRNGNLRGLLAGGTAGTALIAGAIVLFAALATYVAFNESGDSGETDSSATVSAGAVAGAPEAAAAAGGAAAASAVAASPAAPTAIAPAPVTASAQGSPGATDARTGLAEIPVIRGGPGSEPGAGPAGGSGTLGGSVNELDNATADLGLDLPLDDATRPITDPLDQTLNDTLNGVGGVLGNPDLGTQVTDGLNRTTNAILGPGQILK